MHHNQNRPFTIRSQRKMESFTPVRTKLPCRTIKDKKGDRAVEELCFINGFLMDAMIPTLRCKPSESYTVDTLSDFSVVDEFGKLHAQGDHFKPGTLLSSVCDYEITREKYNRRPGRALKAKMCDANRLLEMVVYLERPITPMSLLKPLTVKERNRLISSGMNPEDLRSDVFYFQSSESFWDFAHPFQDQTWILKTLFDEARDGLCKDLFVSHVYHAYRHQITGEPIVKSALAGDNVTLAAIFKQYSRSQNFGIDLEEITSLERCYNVKLDTCGNAILSPVKKMLCNRAQFFQEWFIVAQKSDRLQVTISSNMEDHVAKKINQGRMLEPGSDEKMVQMIKCLRELNWDPWQSAENPHSVRISLCYGLGVYIILSLHMRIPLRPQVTLESNADEWNYRPGVLRSHRTFKTVSHGGHSSDLSPFTEWVLPEDLHQPIEYYIQYALPRLSNGTTLMFPFEVPKMVRAIGKKYLGIPRFGLNVLRTYRLSTLAKSGRLNDENVKQVGAILQTSSDTIKRSYLNNLGSAQACAFQKEIFHEEPTAASTTTSLDLHRIRESKRDFIEQGCISAGSRKRFFDNAFERGESWILDCQWKKTQYKSFTAFLSKKKK